MASSYTGLGTELMTTGENAGTWGTTTNTNLQIIEQISGGYTAQSIAGSAQTTTLSVSDGSTGAVLAHRVIEFTGTITGNQIVTIPLDVQQLYVIKNGTSGAYTVQFKYVSGSGDSVTWGSSDKGTNLIYSGTVSAATEGAVLGIPSIAISLASFKTSDFDLAKTVAIDTVKHVLRYSLPKGTLLNVNVPCCDKDQINGTRVTKQGNQYFVDEYEKRTDPSHKDYYWIKGEIIDDDSSIDYDGKAISENYISITPIHFKLTNEQYLKELVSQFTDE